MNTGSGPVDCKSHFNDYLDSQADDTCHVCLDTGAVVGLSFHAQTGFISLVSLLILLGIIAINYYRKHIQSNGQVRLFRGNIDILMLNLIVADIVMSFGAIADVYWAYHRQVFCGSFCNAQGVLQTMGETVAALSTLAVTIYTFLAIKRNRHTYRPQLYLAIVAAIWLWVLLWAVTPLAIPSGPETDGAGNVKNFYAPTPWWCWINQRYMVQRVLAEYLWLWIAGIGSIVLYVPSYFSIRKQQHAIEREEARQIPMVVQIGRFSQARYPEVAEDPKRPVEPDARSVASSIHAENSGAAKLLWYPFVYTLCVLPLSIIRWAGFVNPELLRSSRIQAPTMVFVGIFNLMGLFNVVLILLTRPAVLLMESYKNPDDPRIATPEDNEPNAARAFSRASDGLSHREGRHERFKTDETRVNERTVVNAFGGVKTSLVRDF